MLFYFLLQNSNLLRWKYFPVNCTSVIIISSTGRCYYVGMRWKKHGCHYFGKVQYLLPVVHCLLFLQKRPNMIKIELLIPLAYFGIVRTLSTETAKTVHFVSVLLLLLLPVYNSQTIAAIDLETAPFYFA